MTTGEFERKANQLAHKWDADIAAYSGDGKLVALDHDNWPDYRWFELETGREVES